MSISLHELWQRPALPLVYNSRFNLIGAWAAPGQTKTCSFIVKPKVHHNHKLHTTDLLDLDDKPINVSVADCAVVKKNPQVSNLGGARAGKGGLRYPAHITGTSCRLAAATMCPRPSPSVCAEAACAAEPTAPADGNVAVGFRAQYVPTLTAAAA